MATATQPLHHDPRDLHDDEAARLANRLHCLLQALPGGVVVLDGRGVVQECNPAAVELLGEPLKGMVWREVIARAFAPRLDDGHEVSLIDGRRVSISTSSLGSEAGQILLLKDVTETRRLQEMLARYQRLSAMGQMAAALAHQIRTPTTAALLYLSQLSSAAGDEKRVRHCAGRIREQLGQIETMVEEMLGHARGGERAAPGRFRAGQLLDRVRATTQAQVEARGGRLECSCRAPDAPLEGHLDELAGALANLVVNALQACRREPRIGLRARRAGEMLEIEVSDNGGGIPEALRSRIFDPFVTGRAGGTGLGLAVAKRVVEARGGTLSFQTETGRGTTFTVRLPLSEAEPAPGASGHGSEVSA